jgi:hypothetical protein
MTSADKGGAELTWLASAPPGTWKSGEYYEKRAPARKLSPQARDAALASALWDRSAAMVGVA